MQDFPPGLTRRRMFPIDRGRVVVEEHWDLNVPGCPMIHSPWVNNPLKAPDGKYVRQIEMTKEQFDAAKPRLSI
jgi:hypothetical protein